MLVQFYVKLVTIKRITIEEVPDKYKDIVRKKCKL